MKKFRSSQASISINCCTELSRPQFFPESTAKVNKINDYHHTLHRKMKFSIKDFFSKCEEILHGKLHFLYSDKTLKKSVETPLLLSRL